MEKKQQIPLRDTPVYDVSDMSLDDLTEEIEKTLGQLETKQKPKKQLLPKGARWSYWT